MLYVITDSLSTYQKYVKENDLNPHTTVYIESFSQLQSIKDGEVHLVGDPTIRACWPAIESEIEFLKTQSIPVIDLRIEIL